MISIDDARWIVASQDAAVVARNVWRAAVDEDGEAQNAEAVLDLRTGRVVYRSRQRDRAAVYSSPFNVTLAQTLATTREDVIEEGVVHEAALEGLDIVSIHERLLLAYQLLSNDRGAA